jgi:hypothetical protein
MEADETPSIDHDDRSKCCRLASHSSSNTPAIDRLISDLYDIHHQSTRLPDPCPQVIQDEEYTSTIIKYLHHTAKCYLISQLKDEAIGRYKTQQSTPPKHQNNSLFELIITIQQSYQIIHLNH